MQKYNIQSGEAYAWSTYTENTPVVLEKKEQLASKPSVCLDIIKKLTKGPG